MTKHVLIILQTSRETTLDLYFNNNLIHILGKRKNWSWREDHLQQNWSMCHNNWKTSKSYFLLARHDHYPLQIEGPNITQLQTISTSVSPRSSILEIINLIQQMSSKCFTDKTSQAHVEESSWEIATKRNRIEYVLLKERRIPQGSLRWWTVK